MFADPNQSQIHSLSEIKCDANGTLKVHAGENVTIHCKPLPGARYRWTKVKEKQREGKKTVNQLISDVPLNFTSFTERQDDLFTSDIKTYNTKKKTSQFERYSCAT